MIDSVTVGMCTYRRPEQVLEAVAACLQQLDTLEPSDAHRVLVVDNDAAAGGQQALLSINDPRLHVVVEPTPGIAAARNRVLDECDTDILVFIDDDELPTEGWLRSLLDAMQEAKADAASGPVKSLFGDGADPWVVRGGFFDRPHRDHLHTGDVIDEAATNNLALRMSTIHDLGLRFRLDLGLSGGSDSAFTREFSRRGGRIVWCREAGVTEVVPADRATRDWVMRRALRFGNGRALRELTESEGDLKVRAALLAGGVARCCAGGARCAAGFAVHRPLWQGRGARTTLVGAGMVLGATGWVYREYVREGPHLSRAAAKA